MSIYYYEPVNLNKWNMFEKVKSIGHIEPFLATSSMNIGDIVLLHVGSQNKRYKSGIYAIGTIVKAPYILENSPEDYCNNKLTVDVRIDKINYSSPYLTHAECKKFINQFRTVHKIDEKHYLLIEEKLSMNFQQWLKEMYKKADGEPLSKRSIDHYVSGLSVVSDDMLKEGVIDKPLEEMNLMELDLAISIIMKTPSFIEKDKKGKGMYSNSLKRYRCYVYHNTDLGKKEVEEIEDLQKDKKLTETEKETLIKARKGQGVFRKKLEEKYKNKCIITDIDISKVLIASHIKPWAVSNNEERLSVDNGLLLSATFDRLFDSGLVTFKKDGTLLISNLISKDNIEKLHLKEGQIYDIKYNPGMDEYLSYHNEVIYVGNIR